MILYRNPLDQWFWETGWRYIGGIALVVLVLLVALYWLNEISSKSERKKRWLAMNETQRTQWRMFNQRNNFECKEWEKP